MKNNSELIVITKSKDLISYIFLICENAPKKFRFTLINKMQNISLEILECLIMANESALNKGENSIRYGLQKEAIAKLKVLDSLTLISREQKCILPKQYEILTKHISDCINLTGAWINSDKKRIDNMGIQL